MTSITIRNLSEETKARLRQQAAASGRSLEAYVRTLLDQAAGAPDPAPAARFPYDLVALVEPGEDIEPLIAERDDRQRPVEL
ncbi:MAG: toxin-antitoxin system antitoxin subunit [Gammaproteobacteria bacterium]|jgi:plasmid stability protein|nr:toxin-antitoxin system antitoxin subunit [Gammaproteobacteria bacterium]